MGIHLALFGPALEPPAGEPFLTKPEPLAIVAKDFEGGPPAIEKDKDGTGKWIGLEHLAADARKPVNAFAKVDGLNASKDTHLRADLDHLLWLTKELIRFGS